MLGRKILGISKMIDFTLIAILKIVIKLWKFSRKPEHGKY